MNIIFWIFYIIISLYIGTLISSLAMAISNGQPIKLFTRCSSYNSRLSLLDMLPVVRHCKNKISFIYLLGELLTLLIFIIIALFISDFYELVIAYLFAIIMIATVLSDIKYQIIPNKITYFGIVMFSVLRLFIHPLPIWNYFIGAIVGSGFLLLIAIVSRGGMGGGDIKLFVVIGLVLGWQNTVLALFLSIMAGGIISIILLLFKLIDRKQMIPFGPFIFIGTMVTYFLGNQIWKWYL